MRSPDQVKPEVVFSPEHQGWTYRGRVVLTQAECAGEIHYWTDSEFAALLELRIKDVDDELGRRDDEREQDEVAAG